MVYIETDRVDVPMDGAARRAHHSEQGRVHPHRQEEGARHVPELRLRQSHILVRRVAEEILAGSVPAADGGALT